VGIKIYLAGKITDDNWRDTIVNGLVETLTNAKWYEPGPSEWPILKASIFDEFDYVGPYCQNLDHHGECGTGFHGEPPFEGHTPSHGLSYVADDCLSAIRKADLVFAWLDSRDAHGTYAEIGIARALGKIIVVSGPVYMPELWFIYALCHQRLHAETPRVALHKSIWDWRHYLYARCLESPIEELFWRESLGLQAIGLVPQVQAGRYRIDFAVPAFNVAIEIDGHDYHKSKDQRTRDAKRERVLEREGWRVIRFTGSEVYHDAKKCVQEVIAMLETIEAERDMP